MAKSKRKPFQDAIQNLKEKIKFWINSGMEDHDIMMQVLNTPFTTEVFRKMDPKEPVNLWPDVVHHSSILTNHSQSEENRISAVIRLGEILSKFSVQALEKALLFDPSLSVRLLAVDALQKIGTKTASNALENAFSLEHEAKHPNAKLSVRILFALKEIGNKEQKALAIKMLPEFKGSIEIEEQKKSSKKATSSKSKAKSKGK